MLLKCRRNINFPYVTYDLHENILYFSCFFSDKTCKPPRGNICIEIRSCPYFAELLNKTPIPRPKSVIKFIKEYQCGFYGNVPKVCCNFKNMNLNSDIVKPYVTNKISDHQNIKLLPKECGKLSNDFRITGGTKTSLLEFPWMALIAYDTGFM